MRFISRIQNNLAFQTVLKEKLFKESEDTKMKVCDMKSDSKYIRIAVILVLILLTGLILLLLCKPKDSSVEDNTSVITGDVQVNENEDIEEEEEYVNSDYEEAYLNDPAIEEVRYYNDVVIPRYSKEYVVDADIYCMCRYIRFACSKFVDLPADFDMANSLSESRGSNLYVYYNDDSDYREYVEIEIDADDSSIYYVKFTNNQNNDISWYTFHLIQNEDVKYSVECEKVEYDSIASRLATLENEINPLTDNRYYCEWTIEEQKQTMGCDELYWEGMSEPLTVDTLMQIYGYED